MRKVTLFLLLLISSTVYGQNLRTLNKDIVDENNNEVILRSAGLGGWMLQEPYMFNYSSGANTQHEFKEKLNNLVIIFIYNILIKSSEITLYGLDNL